MSFELLAMVFLSRAQRKLLQAGAPILTYHSLGPAPAGALDPYLYTFTPDFERQLVALKLAGHKAVTLDEAMTAMSTNEKKCVITFDDGYENVFRHGLAPLARQGAKAIQFLVGGLIGRQNEWLIEHGDVPERLMDAGQIREWLAAGHEIGSHTMTHANLTKLSAAGAREEISASKKCLEDMFGRPVRHFCYPGGRWNETVRGLVADAGYATACTVQFGVNRTGTPRHELRRIIPLSGAALAGKAVHRLLRKLRPAAGKTNSPP